MSLLRVVAAAILIAVTCGAAALDGQRAGGGARGGPPPGSSAGVPAAGGAAGPTEEQLKQLVVMLQVSLNERTYNGAGIIVGQGGNQLYILTAKHVVREGLKQAESVRVRFRWLPGEWKEGKVLDDFDEALDIAVLAVGGLSALSVPDLQWNAVVSPSAVKPGSDVVPIGFPDGRAWFTPQLRSKVQEVSGQYVEFQGELHAGNSGGALVTGDWGIVSVVSQIRPPTNQSSRIDRALEKLKEWGYPVALTERPTAVVTQTSSGRETSSGRGRGTLIPPIGDRARWRWVFFPPPSAGYVLITTMDDGNIACASYDGGGCLWGVTVDQINFTRLAPLVCGDAHRARWGVSGYEDPKHWCSLARQQP